MELVLFGQRRWRTRIGKEDEKHDRQQIILFNFKCLLLMINITD